MKLSVKERIVLVGLLPATGDITSMKQVRVLREELAFNDEENKNLKIQHQPNGSVTWSKDGEIDKEIEIVPVMLEVIKGKLNELNEQKSITDEILDIWELFMDKVEGE